LKWKVNGTTYDGNSVSVDLPHGTYTAKFTVNDGTFIDSDTATISVIDQLNISRVYSEAICPGGLGRMIIDWNRNPHASYYEMERKITNSSWSSEGTTTGTNNLLRTSSGPTRVVERFRVRACSNSKCGSWATETYYTPDCGNFMPN